MNPLERLAGGNLPPTYEESARKIREQLAAEKLARIAVKGANSEREYADEIQQLR